MDDNLLASIFRTNEKIQECLAQSLPLTFDQSDFKEKIRTERREVPRSREVDEFDFEERYIVSVIGAKQQKNDSLVSKSVFIAYEISITRISDGFTKSVFRRFREIRALYKELIRMDDEIADNNHIVFPEYSEGWFGASQVDLESDLVQRRKSDLQAFFFELFHQYPILFHHMKVIEFLELKSMPAKSHSTYSMHFAKKNDVDVELSEELISDFIYNSKTGRLESMNPESAFVWSPSCVEFLIHSEKFPRKSNRAKAELQ